MSNGKIFYAGIQRLKNFIQVFKRSGLENAQKAVPQQAVSQKATSFLSSRQQVHGDLLPLFREAVQKISPTPTQRKIAEVNPRSHLHWPLSPLYNIPDLQKPERSGLELLQESIKATESLFKSSRYSKPVNAGNPKHIASQQVLSDQTVFNKQFNVSGTQPHALQTVVHQSYQPLLQQLKQQGYKGNLVRDVRDFHDEIIRIGNQLIKNAPNDPTLKKLDDRYQALVHIHQQLDALLKQHGIHDAQQLAQLANTNPAKHEEILKLSSRLDAESNSVFTYRLKDLIESELKKRSRFKNWNISGLGTGSQSMAWKFSYPVAQGQPIEFVVKFEHLHFQHAPHSQTKDNLAYVPYTMNTIAMQHINTHNTMPSKLSFNTDYLAVSDSRKIGQGNFTISEYRPDIKQATQAPISEHHEALKQAMQSSQATQQFKSLELDPYGQNGFYMPNGSIHIIDLFRKK
jgi:hypothetical protein